MIKKAASKTTKKPKKTMVKKKSVSKVSKKTKKKIAPEEFYTLIAKKAYEFYVDRGYSHGDDQLDWYEAEKAVSAKYRT